MEFMEPQKFRRHILKTYFNLRFGMGLIAFAFPLLLWPGILFFTDYPDQQITMSHYYHTPMRNTFVGCLFALGTFLILYKGFSRREHYALTLAGIFAIGVALCPTTLPPKDPPVPKKCSCEEIKSIQKPKNIPDSCTVTMVAECNRFTTKFLHGMFAILLFGAIAYVSIFRGPDTLYLLEEENKKLATAFKIGYRIIGALMIIIPGLTALALYFLQQDLSPAYQTKGFWVEVALIWMFSAYWFLKTIEIRHTQADRRLMDLKNGT